MAVVGTEIGQVNNLNQGEGLATTFGAGNRALDTYDQLSAEKRAVGRAKEAQKQAQMDAGLKRMLDFNPDRWFKHEQVIKSELNNWQDQGSRLMSSGINPWTSTDPQSLDWRKKQIEIQGLAEASKQVKDAYVSVRGKIDGADPGKYTPASVVDWADYADTDIKDIVGKRLSPPLLMQTKPMLQLQDHFSKVVSAVNQTRNGNPLSEQDKWDIAKKSIDDPKSGSDLTDSFVAMFAQMDQQAKDDIRRRAQAAGVSEIEQLGKDYVDRYATERKPFQYGDWKADALKRVEVPYKEWQGTESFSKKVDKAELEKITNRVATDMFVNDERALQEYEKVLPRKQGEMDGVYLDRAKKHLAQSLREETATNELAGQRESGKAKQDLDGSRVKWLDFIMSPDPEKYKEAAGYLFETGDVMGNMTVADSSVEPASSGANMLPYPVLRVKLKGNLELKDIKDQLGAVGEAVTRVDQRGTETEFDLPITNQTENYLLSLHDKAFEQKKKSPFAGSFRETKPLTLSQIAKGQKPVIAPTNQKFDF